MCMYDHHHKGTVRVRADSDFDNAQVVSKLLSQSLNPSVFFPNEKPPLLSPNEANDGISFEAAEISTPAELETWLLPLNGLKFSKILAARVLICTNSGNGIICLKCGS